MKGKLKIAVLAGGALAGFASLIPLTSYAATSPQDVTITATVNPAITLDPIAGDVELQGDAGEVLTGTISTKVKANTTYHIGFKVAGTYNTAHGTAMYADDISDTIPAGTNVVAGTNAWGIKAKPTAGDTTDAAGYTEIKATDTNLYTSAGKSNDNGDTINFAIGISTASNITAGSYTISLTVTASAG